MKQNYLKIMSFALESYGEARIKQFFDKVKREGLTEHGFPRLTANIGILLSHGIHGELLPMFCEMMELCCSQVPKVRAANDFSVKELIFCILELERSGIVETSAVDGWKLKPGQSIRTPAIRPSPNRRTRPRATGRRITPQVNLCDSISDLPMQRRS